MPLNHEVGHKFLPPSLFDFLWKESIFTTCVLKIFFKEVIFNEVLRTVGEKRLVSKVINHLSRPSFSSLCLKKLWNQLRHIYKKADSFSRRIYCGENINSTIPFPFEQTLEEKLKCQSKYFDVLLMLPHSFKQMSPLATSAKSQGQS